MPRSSRGTGLPSDADRPAGAPRQSRPRVGLPPEAARSRAPASGASYAKACAGPDPGPGDRCAGRGPPRRAARWRAGRAGRGRRARGRAPRSATARRAGCWPSEAAARVATGRRAARPAEITRVAFRAGFVRATFVACAPRAQAPRGPGRRSGPRVQASSARSLGSRSMRHGERCTIGGAWRRLARPLARGIEGRPGPVGRAPGPHASRRSRRPSRSHRAAPLVGPGWAGPAATSARRPGSRRRREAGTLPMDRGSGADWFHLAFRAFSHAAAAAPWRCGSLDRRPARVSGGAIIDEAALAAPGARGAPPGRAGGAADCARNLTRTASQ